MELPPHTRRIREVHDQGVGGEGTTSAHAENTQMVKAKELLMGNYLRTRGEYWVGKPPPVIQSELPPHTRRIQGVVQRLRV